MTTMGLRPYEHINSSRFPSHPKKSRRSNYINADFPSVQRTGHYYTQNCTINTMFQQKFEKTHCYKLQTQENEHGDNRRHAYADNMENNHDHSYNPCKYERKSSLKSNSSSFEKNAKNSQLSTASESESSSSNSSSSNSELSGFKIVQEGKIVHNETEEELDSPRIGLKMEDNRWNFASSVMVTGPNVKDISIPSFI